MRTGVQLHAPKTIVWPGPTKVRPMDPANISIGFLYQDGLVPMFKATTDMALEAARYAAALLSKDNTARLSHTEP